MAFYDALAGLGRAVSAVGSLGITEYNRKLMEQNPALYGGQSGGGFDLKDAAQTALVKMQMGQPLDAMEQSALAAYDKLRTSENITNSLGEVVPKFNPLYQAPQQTQPSALQQYGQMQQPQMQQPTLPPVMPQQPPQQFTPGDAGTPIARKARAEVLAKGAAEQEVEIAQQSDAAVTALQNAKLAREVANRFQGGLTSGIENWMLKAKQVGAEYLPQLIEQLTPEERQQVQDYTILQQLAGEGTLQALQSFKGPITDSERKFVENLQVNSGDLREQSNARAVLIEAKALLDIQKSDFATEWLSKYGSLDVKDRNGLSFNTAYSRYRQRNPIITESFLKERGINVSSGGKAPSIPKPLQDAGIAEADLLEAKKKGVDSVMALTPEKIAAIQAYYGAPKNTGTPQTPMVSTPTSPNGEGFGSTLGDFSAAFTAGLAKLPVGASQIATDAADAMGGGGMDMGFLSSVLGALTNPIDYATNPDVRRELSNSTLDDIRQAQAGAVRRINNVQDVASAGSPSAAMAGDLAGQIGQVAAIPAGSSFKAMALSGGGTAAGMAAAQPKQEVMPGVESLKDRGGDATLYGAIGAVATPFAAKAIEKVAAPAVNTMGGGLAKIKDLFGSLGGQADDITVDVATQGGLSADDVLTAIRTAGDDVKGHFTDGMKKGLTKEQAATYAVAKKNGVQLSLGDITQNNIQQGFEDAALKGMYGEEARATAAAFREAQQGQIKALVEKTGQKLSGLDETINAADAGEALVGALKKTAGAEKAAAGNLQEGLMNLRSKVPTQSAANAVTRFERQLKVDQRKIVNISSDLAEALDDVRGFLAKSGDDISIRQTEILYKRLNAIDVQPGTQQALVVSRAKEAIRNFRDDAITKGLLKGSPDDITTINRANKAWAEYKQRYFGKDGKALIGKIVKNDYSPEDVTRLIYGSSVAGAKRESANAIKQLNNILGKDSAEMGMLRQAHFYQIFKENIDGILSGSNIEKGITGTAFAKNLDTLFQKNPRFMRELYGDEGIAVLKETARIIKQATNRQPGAVNYSGTTPALVRYLSSVLDTVGRIPGGSLLRSAGGLVRMGGNKAVSMADEQAALQGFNTVEKLPSLIKKITGTDGNAFVRGLTQKATAAGIAGLADDATTATTRPETTSGGGLSPEKIKALQDYYKSQPQSNAISGQGDEGNIGAMVNDALLTASDIAGVDNGLLKKIVKVESNFNPNAKARTSRASGLFQFIPKTWNAMVDKYGAEHGITKADILDARANAVMGALFTRDNKQSLQKSLGREPSAGEVYTAHFLGLGDARRLLKAGASQNAVSMFPKAAKANKPIFYNKDGTPRTVAEVRRVLNTKVS